jgi:RimJ/RimL family protein N-acetyltransferase
MTAEILAATEHLVLRRMTNDDAAALTAYRSDPVQARYQSWETPDPHESTLLPHTAPSRLRELWAPCGHGTQTSRSKIKRHAVDLGIHRWGGWGSIPTRD